MFSWKLFEQSKSILSAATSYKDLGGQHHVAIRPSDLLRWIEFMKDDLGYLTLVDVTVIELPATAPYPIELIYLLLNMESHQRFNLHVRLAPSELIPSIVAYYDNADWLEREQRERFGLRFDRQMDNLYEPSRELITPTLRSNPNKSEAPYPEEAWVWRRYDLLSSMSSSNFEWLVCFDPNRVVDSRTKIGFYREGFERLLETKDWNQVLNLVDRLNLGGAPTYAVAWVRVLEDLLRIRLPERAQALRIVGLELARILEHLVVLAQVCEALKLPEAQLFLNAHEKVTELVERFAGHRQGLGLINLGGVRQDLPHGWVVEYEVVSELVKKNLQLILKSLLSQRLFRGRLDGPALNAQTVLNWGISGPAMRAAGLNFDLRKSQPFYFYQDIDFDVPVGINGTAFDRFLIRYEELQQSFRIITQVIDNLPLGEFVLEDLNRSYPETWRRLRQLERIKDWHYVALESAHGEAGFSFLLDDELRPSNIKIKTPSFAIAQALKHFVSGLQEDQLRAGVLSLGIRRHELDR